ncbi:protein kinase [Synechococcus sp. Tobar12-5m-g]|uniref:serine/threonine protein kinase n=1 Tax=unclassified Synechococcus TaxID=2626047 RepID=UPI0020CBAE73|nr:MULTISPECIES: protein kinase [unclassified Synechococcus]MCP9771981.1 protein kinase [Synechococcus sp. Tobar12-5m-g]MCP9872923.1 protein kinase [Synechococcus sp. Cruz CV-v-12]
MDSLLAAAPGVVIADRYRLEVELGQGSQGTLWRASDQLAAEAPMVLRQLGQDQDQPGLQALWSRLQGVLHPQLPRFGEVISRGGDLWLVREWQGGRSFQDLIEARRERQLVFGAGEVLLLLRQLLPALAVLHGQELVHGDLSPANLLRRDRDGLPVLLDFGLTRAQSSAAAGGTPGYAPPELARGETAQPWMDLYSLGVVALVMLSGEEPAQLLDPGSLAWRWPAGLALDPPLKAALERLISADPSRRFASASQALEAFQQLPMPESTGPVPRADRTVVLVPTALEPSPPDPPTLPAQASSPQAPQPQPLELPRLEPDPQAPPPPQPPRLPPRTRQQDKEEAVEGRLWPLVVALVLSAVVGISLGWWLLGRSKAPASSPTEASLQLPASLPPAEVDQRQQLLNRLRALQVNRGWFLKLVDASLLAQYPERGGRLPGDSLEDAPFRKVWNELAEEWLARVEALPLALRSRLGDFTAADWEAQQRRLAAQGLSPAVLRQLVSGNAQALLPGRSGQDIPPEPLRQLWYAAAQQSLQNLRIESIEAAPGVARVVSAQIEAGGARLFPIRVPPGYRLALGVNGSPLMQMSVYDSSGALLESKGPLRVVTLGKLEGSQVQLLVSNDGVAPAMITLSLRADAPPPDPAGAPVEVAPGATAEPQTPPPAASPAPREEQPQVPVPPAPPVPAAPAAPPAPPSAPRE